MSTSPPTVNSRDDESAAEYRAYLQRGETRLSTLHRVAGSFISGAGLLTLLPLLISQTFSQLLAGLVFVEPAAKSIDSGFPPSASGERWLALAPVLASIGLPLGALYLLIRELTIFYFTPRSFRSREAGRFYPRFILSGIMVSSNPPFSAARELEEARNQPYVRDLLVPETDKYVERLLKEAHAIGQLRQFTTATENPQYLRSELQDYILRQTGSEIRSLADESAKMESSIARHQSYLRSLVLRYAKAFLLTIATTVATIGAVGTLGLVTNDQVKSLVQPHYVWLTILTIYCAWCVTAVVVVRRPVDWIYADVTNVRSKRTPQSLLSFERATMIVVGAATIALCADLLAYADEVSIGVRWWPYLAAVTTAVTVALVIGRIIRGERGSKSGAR
jgi:hypothetical protein